MDLMLPESNNEFFSNNSKKPKSNSGPFRLLYIARYYVLFMNRTIMLILLLIAYAYIVRIVAIWQRLTQFSPVSHFYTPWKRQKTKGFLTFSGGIEMWHWTKMS